MRRSSISSRAVVRVLSSLALAGGCAVPPDRDESVSSPSRTIQRRPPPESIPLVLHVVAGAPADGDGSSARPFSSPGAALDALRAKRRSGDDARAALELTGTFHLDAPLVVDDELCGTSAAGLVLRNARGRSAVLSGARPVAWSGQEGPLRVAAIPPDAADGWVIEHLRVGTAPTFRARHPNYDPARPHEGYFTVKNTGSAASLRREIVYDGGTFPAGFDWGSALLDVFIDDSWQNAVFRIASAAPANATIRGSFALSNGLAPGFGSRFFVENARQALDAPGEWFHDVSARRLYYWPRSGEVLDASNPALPARATSLLRIVGSAARRAHDVTVSGITFVDTNGSWARPEAALVVRDAERVRIADATFRELNGMAVLVDRASAEIAITHSRFTQVGSTAIGIFGRPDAAPRAVTVTANRIERIGRINKEGRGIHAHAAKETSIADNYIALLPRAAIQATGELVVVERNVVRHVGLETADLGALLSGGDDNGSVTWRHNVVHDVVGLNTDTSGRLVTSSSAHGFYGDVRASRHRLEANLFTGAMTRSLVFHGGTDNVAVRNALLDRGVVKLWPLPMEAGDGRMRRNVFEENIVYFASPATAFVSLPAGYWDPLVIRSNDNRIVFDEKHRDALWASASLTPVGTWTAWRARGFDVTSNWGAMRFAAVRQTLSDVPSALLDLAERDFDGRSAVDLVEQLPVGPRPE